jgi:UPF0271 protein
MVTLNADLGESFGIHTFGNDEGLVKLIDAANVACGFHAGDPTTMRETISIALAAGVSVGAHPGLPDLVGFGRREMKLDADEVADIVRYQVGALSAFLAAEGAALSHIKPHGALYGMTARDQTLMDAVSRVAEQFSVPVYGMPNTAHERSAAEHGVPFVAEFYVDLEYAGDGTLLIARRPQPALPEVAAARTRLAISEGIAIAATGERIPVRADTICVHSDTPNAVAVAEAVHAVLAES